MKLLFCSLLYSVCSSLQTLLITSVLKKKTDALMFSLFSLLPLLSFPLSLLPSLFVCLVACLWVCTPKQENIGFPAQLFSGLSS